MLERTTLSHLVSRSIYHLRQALAEVQRLQLQALTGKKWLRPSEQPEGVIAAQVYRSTLGQIETFLENLTEVRLTLHTSSQVLQQISGILTQARALAIEGAQDTLTEDARRALATEIDGLLEQVVGLANSRMPNHYVFAGADATKAPFRVVRDSSGRIVRVEYAGASHGASASVAPSYWAKFLYPGIEVFRSSSVGSGQIMGDPTGLALGTGTSRVQGRVHVLIKHTATTYGSGSGVAPGNSSPVGDTVLGPSGTHWLHLQDTSGTGSSGLVSLNGGPAIAWTNTDTDLRVVGPNGEVVFVNTTNITPGFSGTVAITAQGTLSLDGGATNHPITFTPDQQVIDNQGNVLFLDTSSLRRTGENWVEFPHSYDLFTALIHLRDELENSRRLPAAGQTQALSRMITALDAVHQTILHALGEQSTGLASLDMLEEHLEQVKLSLQFQLGRIEEADLAELVVRLQAQQNLLTLLLGATAQILQPNLLDFLG
ncbi:MAG: hypothetical protein RMI91_06665 [Gemmatales bacterium]|nr:hypothetical protein [Gemmatales bacterium]MDW7994319.1 hypothetical protein [Gemmatales bacterium]